MKTSSTQTANPPSLHLQIDRVSVKGLDARGQQRFVRTLENRLQQLATEPAFREAMAKGSLHLPSLRAGRLPCGTTPEDAAVRVVRSLQQHVMREKGARSDV